MGNDELLEKYMSGKPFKMSELEQEENRRFQNGTLFPFITEAPKTIWDSAAYRSDCQ